MTKQVQLNLQIGSKFYAEITCDEDQTGRTHRAQIRTAVATITTKMDLATGSGITIHSTNPKILILEKGATATEAIVCPTDSALWVFDCESLGATADDKVREAEGPVYVTRDVTRASESTADADASKLFTYSLTDGQTLTTEEQENAREKLGITAGEPFSFIVNNGAPVGALGAEIGWYCFDYANGNLYGPLPDYTAPEVPEWPLVGQIGVGTGDSRLSDARTPTAHTHPLSAITQSGATSGQVPTWSGSAWAPANPSAGGGMAIGGAITSAVNNRILQSDASGNLAQQSKWYFDSLGFGAIQPTAQALRTTDGGGGYMADTGGGVLLGRTDDGPQLFVGFYTGGGPVVHVNSGYRFGNNPNDLRLNDTALTRRAADLIEGACLAMRAYTVGTLPDAATWINAQVVCTNETGGRVPVFSDGTNWRRVTDRAIAS